MKNIKWIALSLMSAALLTSCNESGYEKEIAKINQLTAAIDSAQSLFNGIDTAGIAGIGAKYKSTLSAVQNSYKQKGDSIPRGAAMLMSDYRGLRKTIGGYPEKYAQLQDELTFTRIQLVDLKHDLEYNLLDTNLVRKMLASEREAAMKVINETANLQGIRASIDTKITNLQPRVDSLLAARKEIP